MKKRMLWALSAATGIALIAVAVLLSSSTPSSPSIPAANAQIPTATFTPEPTATATPNPACVLDIDKDAGVSRVAAGGNVTYAITVTNDGVNGSCDNLTVTDDVPNDTTCVSASVEDDNDLTFDDDDITDSCDDNDTVVWDGTGDFDVGDSVELELVLKMDTDLDEDDEIINEACADSDGPGAVVEVCDEDTVRITEATPTPTVAATATPRPFTPAPTVILPPPAPTARPLPTLAPPVTGTGSSGGPNALAMGLGALGACLLLVSGAALVKRTR